MPSRCRPIPEIVLLETEFDVTGLLKEISLGNAELVNDLLPHIYDQLKILAHSRLGKEYSTPTVSTTGLVHEAYFKLVKNPDDVDWQSRKHFFAVASRAMGQVLVNRARARKAEKRGGDATKVSLDGIMVMSEERADELIALAEALEILRVEQPRVAEVVDLRYFGGFTAEECADILGLSESTVSRDWKLARIWLFNRLKD